MLELTTHNVTADDITDLERDAILNYLVKEGISIINDEVEYYFLNQVKILDLVLNGLDLKKINLKDWEKVIVLNLFKVNDIKHLFLRIENRIGREIVKSKYDVGFSVKDIRFKAIDFRQIFQSLFEDLRTIKVAGAVSQVVEMAWRKASPNFLPKAFKTISSRVKPAQLLLSYLGVKPQEMKVSFKEKLSKRLRLILKHYKNEINNQLKKELIQQMYSHDNNQSCLTAKLPLIQQVSNF
jgi:hypothetical protein